MSTCVLIPQPFTIASGLPTSNPSKPTIPLHPLAFADDFGVLPNHSPYLYQPSFPYFLHSLTASAANASGFLQTSLSKILGNIDSLHLQMTRLGFPINANGFSGVGEISVVSKFRSLAFL